MDKCSYFIKNKAIFGSHPSQEDVYNLEDKGVRYFIDLTNNNESNIESYITKYTYIKYPIQDRKYPHDWNSYCKFIVKICNIILNLKSFQNQSHHKRLLRSNDECVYIHCKGGHGRSGVVVATILCYIFNIDPEESLELTKKYHSHRIIMRDKWRYLGSPQTLNQKNFVKEFFEPFYFYQSGITSVFSNSSQHSIFIENIGTFYTAEAALQAYKNINDKEYVNKQLVIKSPKISKFLGRRTVLCSNWNTDQIKITEKILRLKLSQHPDISKKLLCTGLRPIIEHIKSNNFWSDNNHNSSGKNITGKILMKLRNELLLEKKNLKTEFYN